MRKAKDMYWLWRGVVWIDNLTWAIVVCLIGYKSLAQMLGVSRWILFLELLYVELMLMAVFLILMMIISIFRVERGDEAYPANHGDNLEMVMEALRREPLEYSASFDLEGHKMIETTLLATDCSISFALERIDSMQLIHLHNHPGAPEGAFSSTDLRGFPNEYRAMVVTRNYTYILENTQKYDLDEDAFAAYVRRLNYVFVPLETFFPGLIRWCSIIECRLVARKFGLKFQVKSLKREKLKHRIAGVKHGFASFAKVK